MRNNIDLDRRTKAIISAVLIVLLALGTGIRFSNNYVGKPINQTYAPKTTLVEDTEMVEEPIIVVEEPEVAEETSDPVEETEETSIIEENNENTSNLTTDTHKNKTAGDHVGKAFDRTVDVLKGSAGWLGERMVEWGDTRN